MGEVEVQSFLALARSYLKTEKLPERIRNALNAIFSKEDGDCALVECDLN